MKLDRERDRMVDPNALDVEWLEHSNNFDKYSEHLDEMSEIKNDKKLEVEEKEEEVKRIKADLDLRIRKTPEEFELDKVTENSIASAIMTSPEYQTAQDELFELKKELNTAIDSVNRAHTGVNTMMSKRTALQELGLLARLGYFAMPMEPRDLSNEYSRKMKANKKKVKEKIRKRRQK